VPKEESWEPASGNSKRFSEVRTLENKLSKPQRVRIQPQKDGTQLCAGDYCHDKVLKCEVDSGEDLSKFTNQANLTEEAEKLGVASPGGDKKKAPNKNQPNAATHAVLYKSIYLARLERKEKSTESQSNNIYHMEEAGGEEGVFSRLQKTGGMAPEDEQAARCLPQLIPTYASKHSLQDYYDMVPVCHCCFKVYQYLDRQRIDPLEEHREPSPEPPKSPLLGNVMEAAVKELQPVEEEVDNSAAGIRERLMSMYCNAAKPAKDEPISSSGVDAGPAAAQGNNISNMVKISTKKKLENDDEDYEKMFALKKRGNARSSSVTKQASNIGRLPSVKKHETGAFPRSKTSMDGAFSKGSRGFSGEQQHRTLPLL